MKKLLAVFSILFFAFGTAHAANKANVKFGPIKFNSTTGAAAAALGSNTQITLGGNQGTSAGTFTIFLAADELEQLSKGVSFGVVTTNQDFDGDNAVTILFQGSRTKINGFNSSTTGYTSDSDTQATGTFKVVNYDPNTRELKFVLKASAKPYTVSSAALGKPQTNKSSNKPLKITVQGQVTLP